MSSKLFLNTLQHVLHVLYSRLLEAAEERVNEQQKALLDREREIAELRSEFLREAIETSSHLGGMSSRLLALTAENLALKSRPRSRSRSLSVSLQGNEVSDGVSDRDGDRDGDGDGGVGGVARIRHMNDMTGRDDVVRYDDDDNDADADSYQTTSAVSSKNSQKYSSRKYTVRATTHPAMLNTTRGCSAEGVSSGESKEVELSAMRGSAACSIRSSRSTVSEEKNSDVTGASKMSHRLSGVEVLSYQMAAMEMQVSSSNYLYSTVQYSTVQYSTVQYSTVQYSTVQYSTVQYSAVRVISFPIRYHNHHIADQLMLFLSFPHLTLPSLAAT